MPEYLTRELGRAVREALEDMPVVVLTGLRQAGKSTFLEREAGLGDRELVTLDDWEQLDAARRDPDAFVSREGPLTIDEVQRFPELLLAVKRAVDRKRRPGRFILSGSANLALLGGVTESLAGRALYLTLEPFTQREIDGDVAGRPFLVHLFEHGAPPERTEAATPLEPLRVARGGLPVPCLGIVRDRATWFRGYEQTYLERDVRALAQVADLAAFRTLLRLAALRSGNLLRIAELARDAKMSATTCGRYLGAMEASFVLTRLAPFLGNKASRLIKSPKLHLADSGLTAHLCDADDPAGLASEAGWGALLETYVAQQLRGILGAWMPRARLAFWHVQGRHEVDFIIEQGRDTIGIEVKAAARWDERDLSGLQAFLGATPRCRVAVLAHGGRVTSRLGDRLWAIPITQLLG